MAETNKLTDSTVKKTKPKDRDFKLSDGAGMFLLIKANGAKYWRIKFRIGGKEKLLALGVYPEVSLAEARAKRDEIRDQLRQGIDPALSKKKKKAI